MPSSKPTKAVAIASAVVFLLLCGAWGWFATIFPETGWDFSQFYITASIPLSSIYDRAVYEQFAVEALTPLGVDYFPPYVRPAVFALPLKLLAPFSFSAARGIFFAVQFGFFVGTLWLAFRRFHLPWDLLPVFGLFYPALMGIITGQDPHTLAFLAFSGFLLLEKDHDLAAGLVWALCLYKFNLILGLPLLLLVRGRFKALGGFILGGAVLAAVSALLAPPSEYLTLLGSIENYTISFTPDRMIGLRGLAYSWELPWLYPAAALVVLCVSAVLIKRVALPAAFTLAVLGSMLCSYHVNWYDAAVLTPCIAYLMAEAPAPLRILPLVLLVAFPLWAFSFWIACVLTILWICFAVVHRSPRLSAAAIPAA